MKISVVEDYEEDRKRLVSYIKRFSHKQNLKIQISVHTLGENFLEDEDLSTVDVVFLDIYMGKKSGLDVAKILRERGYIGLIIFCTTTAQYALDGYMVKAHNYILKPYTYEKIEDILTDIANILQEVPPSIRIKDGRQWYKIKLSDILYVENNANYVCVHTSKMTYSTRMTFKEMEHTLSAYPEFIRCNRGIIVNLASVQNINEQMILVKNNDSIPISRRNSAWVNEQYLNYIFEEMEGK